MSTTTKRGWPLGVQYQADPTPQQIAETCHAIQMGWDIWERLIRAGSLSREEAESLRAVDRMRRVRQKGDMR